MIKLDTKNRKVETDCKTVGEFMTEAAELSGGNITIIVDGCRYEFHDNPKIMVTDDTPLCSVIVEPVDSLLSGVTVLRVTTKPKPKTVRRSGWVNIYRASFDNYKTTPENMRPAPQVYNSKEAAEQAFRMLSDPAERKMFIATVRVEWEEVAE
ncbi:MAG: hypothetical protein IIV44_05410 [Rikenellaceae bacterium]|nr:hypothetical protein [Clostridia bacterium]MBQ5679345.1 hypothetical protein [Rikenellaceae bacterium]